jgi:ribosomal protein S18 acetylase RimI-like enzyme
VRRTEDTALYARNAESLLASWEINASASRDARLVRAAGVAAAVFPVQPGRSVYNNALLERDLGATRRADALDAMEAAYASAGIPHFAAWVHETDQAMCRTLEACGYVLDPSTTLAMGITLSEGVEPFLPELEFRAVTWPDYLRLNGLPADFLRDIDQRRFRPLGAFANGELVSVGVAFDHHDDCMIYSLMTSEAVRRRGIGTAVTAALLTDAAARGCVTASVQATPIAEGVYAAAGFRSLGRLLEYVPRTTTRIRQAQLSERDALDALQRRSSLHRCRAADPCRSPRASGGHADRALGPARPGTDPAR